MYYNDILIHFICTLIFLLRMHTVEIGLTDGNTQEDLGYIRLLVELRDLLDEELEEGDAESVDVSRQRDTVTQNNNNHCLCNV